MSAFRLAISNIAWAPSQDDAVARIVRAEGFTGVELAPTKRWPAPLQATDAELAACRAEWEARGLTVSSLQALLFGRPDLLVFGDDAVRRQAIDYLSGIARLGGKLGAKPLVFGSPKNRARGSLAPERAFELAVDFFRQVGRAAHEAGTSLCLEANPPQYACDFVTTSAEALALVKAVDTPGFGLHLDLAGMQLAGEDVLPAIRACAGHIVHFHASAPDLGHVAPSAPVDYAGAAAVLREIGYEGWVSVEMREAPVAADNLARIEETARFVRRVFA